MDAWAVLLMPTAQQIRDTVPLKSRFCPLHAKKPSDRGRKALQSLGFSMVAGGGLEPPTSGLGARRATNCSIPRYLVPETGIEPARDCSHGILSPGRLPIPPLRHLVWLQSLKCLLRIPQTKAPVKKIFKAGKKFKITSNSPGSRLWRRPWDGMLCAP